MYVPLLNVWRYYNIIFQSSTQITQNNGIVKINTRMQIIRISVWLQINIYDKSCTKNYIIYI